LRLERANAEIDTLRATIDDLTAKLEGAMQIPHEHWNLIVETLSDIACAEPRGGGGDPEDTYTIEQCLDDVNDSAQNTLDIIRPAPKRFTNTQKAEAWVKWRLDKMTIKDEFFVKDELLRYLINGKSIDELYAEMKALE
jgi:hypothetical protein